MHKTIPLGFVFLVFGIVSAGSQGAALAAEPKTEALARWEYRVVTKEQLLELGNKDLAAGLNKLGNDGWELVAVDPAFIFKRPNQSQKSEEVKGRIVVAEAEVAAWTERVGWSERMVKKGFMTERQLQSEQARLETAQLRLDKARMDLRALPTEPKPMPEKERLQEK
jgi:hypothetical protein